MMGNKEKPQHVNYVHFISDITIRKNGYKSNVFTEFLIQS